VASALRRLEAALTGLAGAEVKLERPKDPAHGDYATNVALQVARGLGRPPRDLAEDLAARALELVEIDRAEVAGPGFLNLWVSDDFLGELLAEIGPTYGEGSAEAPERIQVEMVSANPTGPLTVASARNAAYGDSVARLLEFAGHEVSREYYWNDAGAQMERFRDSVEAVREGREPPEDGYQGAYIAELAAEPGDPVPRMLHQIERTLKRFRVHFDTWLREVELVPEIPSAIAAIETYEAEGTLWAPTSRHGDDKDRPLLRSSDRSHLYFAADIAYLRYKLERFDRAIYVLGADHHGYIGRLTAAAALLGYNPERVEILLYQLVHLTRGGELAKMSKRAGNVVFLDELIDETGVDFARWFLVDRGPDTSIEIDVDLAEEKSRKNPVYYVQYVHARTNGVFREAEEGAEIDPMPRMPLTSEERELVKRLAEFPGLVAEATERRAPHSIAIYAIRVADEFHRFYEARKILAVKGGEHESFRLAITVATRDVIARCLDLVGVDAPERM
jgi:arginyl-tRNA synthetase